MTLTARLAEQQEVQAQELMNTVTEKFELIHGRLDTQHQEFMETNEKSRAQEKMMRELQGERKEMLEEFKVIKQ